MCLLEPYELATDAPSILPNDETFVENRHDQSILSMLGLKYNVGLLDLYDFWKEDLSLLQNSPIVFSRLKEEKLSWTKAIKRKIKRYIKLNKFVKYLRSAK